MYMTGIVVFPIEALAAGLQGVTELSALRNILSIFNRRALAFDLLMVSTHILSSY